jgi:hypothetical protein
VKKALTLVLTIIGLNLVYIQDASAASPVTYKGCTIASVDLVTKVGLAVAVPISQKSYLNSQALTTNCRAIAIKYYAKEYLRITGANAKNDLTSYNARFDNCTGGAGISLNPKSWFIGLKCSFTTAFFPTSNAFKDSYNTLIKEFKTHQPTSYVAVATTTFGGVVSNWGGMTCTSGIPYSVNINNTTMNIKLNCSPPAPIQKLYKFMVLGLWIGFALMLYSLVNKKLGQLL